MSAECSVSAEPRQRFIDDRMSACVDWNIPRMDSCGRAPTKDNSLGERASKSDEERQDTPENKREQQQHTTNVTGILKVGNYDRNIITTIKENTKKWENQSQFNCPVK